MIWKYLGETNSRYTTSLRSYLEHIFKGNPGTWEFDVTIPIDIFNCRKGKDNIWTYHKYRPDARNEHMGLIVEFDGVQHYTNFSTVIGDTLKDAWMEELGYTVIRIPFWLQLSAEVIEYKFGIRINEPMCTLEYSFYDSPKSSGLYIPGVNCSPGSMCESGRQRFVNEFNALPRHLRFVVGRDLLMCKKYEHTRYSAEGESDVLPQYVEDRMDIPAETFDTVNALSAVPDECRIRL